MKYLKYILAILIVFIAPSVYADEFNMNSYTSATEGGTRNRYRGTEIYNTGTSHTYTFGTRYQGRLSDIETYFYYPFEGNTNYRFTYNMATNDFNNNFSNSYWWDCDDTMTNNNAHVFIPTYISYKKIQFSIKPDENTTCIRVWVRSPNLSSGNITQITNWNLSSITLYDPDWQSGSGGGQGTTPTPTPTATPGATNQDIIDSQNNNTQDIINNQNDNTNNIIDNNNENTEKIIDSIKDTLNDCKQVDVTLTAANDSDPNLINKYLNYQGDIGNSNDYNVSKYIEILPDSQYTFTASTNTVNSPAFCTYDSSYTLIRCTQFALESEWYFHTGSNAKYFRTTIANNNTYTLHLLSEENCQNRIDALNDKLDGLSHVIEDSQVDDKSSFFTGFTDNSHGLTGIITLPLSTIQSLTNTSCVALSIPIPFTNESVSLPCMSEVYQTYVPTVFNIWQVVSFGIISYFICIDIFKMVKGFKDPNEDKVEVLDL